jgi:peptidylprolyl isomerase
MRVVALIAVVAVLVAGGFWLARDRDGATPTTTTPATPTASTPAGSGSTPPAERQEPTVEGAVTADGPASTESPGVTDAADAPPAEEPVAGAPATDAPSSQGDAEQASPAPDAPASEPVQAEGAELDLTTLLPVGYSAVDFVTDEPRRLFENPEQVLEPGNDYIALLHTNRGDIVVDLYEDRTPVTVNNFVFLSLNRYYQGVPFHRVLEDFMAQTGDPTGTGSGGPGYQFEDEIVEGLAFDSVGQLAMANAGAGTNGSQFFITFAATAWLTGAHTIFGEVMSGSEVLDTLTRIDPASPSAIVAPTDTVADLAAKGIDLPADDDATIDEALESILGTSPVMGQSFTAAGYRGVMGQMGAEPAYGFFPQPDTILDVVIGARPVQ